MPPLDYFLLADILFLVIFGLLMVYSASNVVASYKYNDEFYYLKRQLFSCVIGLILMYVASVINIEKIYKYTSFIFLASFILLVLVLIPGIGIVRGGARSWIGIGSFSIQPAEFMKIAIILLLAKYLSKYNHELDKIKTFVMVLLVAFIIFGLIVLQPDFGTGLVLLVSVIALIFMAGAPLKYFIALLIIGIIGMGALIISAPYRLERITSFLNPWNDPLGSGFQGIQSLFAIAPSGIFGFGYNKSMQKHFFLPEPQNDFIYAIITEEFGLFGGIVVLLAYVLLFIKAIKISARIDNSYMSYLAKGIGISIIIQVFINICVVIGLLPITGITMPIISYGGSSLTITLIGLGLLLNISRYQISLEGLKH